MLDAKYVVANFEAVKAGIERRGGKVDLSPVEALVARRRGLIASVEARRQEQNAANDRMKALAASGDRAAMEGERAKLRELSDATRADEKQLEAVEAELNEFMLLLPNIPDARVPDGRDEHDNRVVRTWGTPRAFDFVPADHVTIGEKLGTIDFERAAKVSGARFVVLKGAAARLARALMQFMLDLHTREHGYTEVLAPYMVNRDSMMGTGQLPKFEEDLFALRDDPHFLIPTAEVSVTNLHRDEILDMASLPVKYCSFSPCFRREAGSYGRDTRGMIRQHQFHKVELVWFTHPEKSWEAHEQLVAHAEKVLQLLELPYRVMALCAGDMGQASAMTYDLEVWLPSQNTYREISSCSNFVDYQARRARIRCKDGKSEKAKPMLVHTLNGSGLAVGRTHVAILENYQQADGSVVIPDVWRPHLGGMERIG